MSKIVKCRRLVIYQITMKALGISLKSVSSSYYYINSTYHQKILLHIHIFTYFIFASRYIIKTPKHLPSVNNN